MSTPENYGDDTFFSCITPAQRAERDRASRDKPKAAAQLAPNAKALDYSPDPSKKKRKR